MKRKLTLQDYKAAMDAFAATLPPTYPVTIERQDVGDAARYVLLSDGLEAGRIDLTPPPAWETGAVKLVLASTARTRGINASMAAHGDHEHIPEQDRALDALYCDILKRWRAHMDLWLGRGMWEGVWDMAGSDPEPQPETGPQHPDSGHYKLAPEQRRAAAEEYRRARAEGRALNKEAWARMNWDISRPTLNKYLKEFPEPKP